METLILYPQNREQLNAIKTFAKALKIPFEQNKVAAHVEREKGMKLYGTKMVKAVESAEKDIKNGDTTRIKKES